MTVALQTWKDEGLRYRHLRIGMQVRPNNAPNSVGTIRSIGITSGRVWVAVVEFQDARLGLVAMAALGAA